ncbi:MAG: trigger factor [Nitrospiraceae bacterium]|nr:MAG: trigger factor [Nitrospiraceae bacterium]
MLKDVEETSPTTRKLTINISPEIIDKEMSNAYNRLRTNAKIPGFRVGKVPQAILEKKFGKDIEAQVLEKIVPEFYSEAVKQAKIFPITYPEIAGKLELKKNQPLSFTATVEVKPELKDISSEGIVLKEKTFSVEETEIEAAIKMIRESRALLQVTDGPIQEGDMAVIDYSAFVDKNEVKELQSKDYPFILGSHVMPRTFSEAFSGKKKGDSFEVTIPFESDTPNKTIAGKDVLFKVTVKEMKKRILPDLDEEFAKGLSYGSMEELKKNISENIEKKKKTQIDSEYKRELTEHLISNHSFEVPQSMVNRELESLIDESKQHAMSKGKTVKPDGELRTELEPLAFKNVKAMLILDTIGKKEKIEVNEDDMKEAIDEVASQHNLKPEEVKKLYIAQEGSLDGLKHRLYTGKVLDFVLSKANIEKSEVKS